MTAIERSAPAGWTTKPSTLNAASASTVSGRCPSFRCWLKVLTNGATMAARSGLALWRAEREMAMRMPSAVTRTVCRAS
eukprot:scaffold216525_cov25-Tisochrysis_lutea.AAC.1